MCARYIQLTQHERVRRLPYPNSFTYLTRLLQEEEENLCGVCMFWYKNLTKTDGP